jgi:hypothetical protein
MAVLILPAATVIALFSREIMLLWTRPEIASQTADSQRPCGRYRLNGLMNRHMRPTVHG